MVWERSSTCDNKAPYGSWANARRDCRALRLTKDVRGLRPYRCPFCHQVHVGTPDVGPVRKVTP